MYFFIIESFNPFHERLIPSISGKDLFKVSIVSQNFLYDIDAQVELESILNAILTQSELDELTVDYNPDFFPTSVNEFLFPYLESEEPLDSMELNDNAFAIGDDGLPVMNDQQPQIEDFIQATYIISDDVAETIALRACVIVDPATSNTIDFLTNTTVH